MKLLIILILLLSILMMGAALKTCIKEPHEHLEKGVWLGMFPLFILVTIFCTVNLIIPKDQPFITVGQNISILFYLFSCMLFGLSTKFTKERLTNWSLQQ